MEVRIARIHPDAHLPQYKTLGSACFDFETIEEKVIKPGEIAMLRTGLVVETPPGYFLAIAPRSSLHKSGLDKPHSFGILDPDYSGPEDEVKIMVRNFSDKPVKIEKYQRLAQGYFSPVPKIVWKEISPQQLKKESRGGIGSTGKK
jgi:dUTP pyrophosphatase